MIAFRRIDRSGHELIAVCNFTPIQREHYCIGVPKSGTYTEVFTSDAAEFGGTGVKNGACKTRPNAMHGHPQSIELTLPPLSVIFLQSKGK